jgi:CheY-like chemotaxis protein
MSKLILIADDEFGLAEVLAQLLSDRGHEALVAVNGAAALERMAERRPDLVLLDVMMPMLDGPGLLRRMRDDPRLADIPVVLMTARPDQIAPEIRAIAQGLLVKPFTPAALAGTVDPLLR